MLRLLDWGSPRGNFERNALFSLTHTLTHIYLIRYTAVLFSLLPSSVFYRFYQTVQIATGPDLLSFEVVWC